MTVIIVSRMVYFCHSFFFLSVDLLLETITLSFLGNADSRDQSIHPWWHLYALYLLPKLVHANEDHVKMSLEYRWASQGVAENVYEEEGKSRRKGFHSRPAKTTKAPTEMPTKTPIKPSPSPKTPCQRLLEGHLTGGGG